MKRFLLVLLLPALAALASDPWTDAKLDAAKLEARLKEAQEKAAALPDPAAPGGDELLRRVSLLKELLATLQDRGRFLDPKIVADRKARAEQDLEKFRAQPPLNGALGVQSKDQVAAYEATAVQREAEYSAAQKALDELVARQKALLAESALLPARIAEAKRRVESDESKGSGDQADLVAGNLTLELRAAQERADYVKEALDRWATRVPMQQAERDLAKARLDRAQAEQGKAREEWAKLSEQQAKAEREKAAAQEKEAAKASDPIERFRRSKLAETARVQAELSSDDAYLSLLQQRITDQQKSSDALDAERSRLAARFSVSGTGSERVASLLLGALERFRLSREVLVRRTLPAIYKEIGSYQNARAETQDRIYELESVREENRDWLALLAEAGQARAEEVRQAYAEIVDGDKGLLVALRARAEVLDRIESGLVSLEAESTRRLQNLDRSISFILARILWVKSDPTLGPSTISGAATELGRLALFYARRDVRDQFVGAYSRSPGRFFGVVGGMLASLVLGFVGLHRLRNFRAAWHYRGGPFWAGVQRVAVALLLSLIVPALLYVAAILLGLLELPTVIEQPALSVMRLLAFIWFVRRFSWRLLRAEDGIAISDLGVPPDVSAQLLRAVRTATTAALILLVPSEVLADEPFLFTHIPRLLYPCFLAGMALALIPLVRRRGALVGALTGRSGVAFRSWGLVGSLLSLGLLAIVAMDVFGFRYGARQLMRSAVQSLAMVLLLAGLYRLLRRLAEKLAMRVRSRAAEEEGYAAAWEQSKTVLSQLTRVVAVVVLVVAFLVLMNAWDLDAALRAFLEQAHLSELSDGVFLTFWDVLLALFWIGGAHFLLANISGVYEFLVFPLMGATDKGGRFVWLALSRYVILLVAYSAALLELHFSFSSVGWLLAAASVGLGFGLQEIVANFVSGLILLLEQPVRVGDVISVGSTGGTVDKINIRATIVTNWDRQQIIVPNKIFITENLVNWTRNDDIIRRVIRVGVAYGSDVEKVLKVLKEIAEGHPNVVKDPPPRIWFENFGDSSLDFEVWCFIRIPDGKQTTTEIRSQIARRFEEEGIEIPFPQRDLHIRSSPDDALLGGLVERARTRPG